MVALMIDIIVTRVDPVLSKAARYEVRSPCMPLLRLSLLRPPKPETLSTDEGNAE